MSFFPRIILEECSASGKVHMRVRREREGKMKKKPFSIISVKTLKLHFLRIVISWTWGSFTWPPPWSVWHLNALLKGTSGLVVAHSCSLAHSFPAGSGDWTFRSQAGPSNPSATAAHQERLWVSVSYQRHVHMLCGGPGIKPGTLRWATLSRESRTYVSGFCEDGLSPVGVDELHFQAEGPH